jgi:hypothetical protein
MNTETTEVKIEPITDAQLKEISDKLSKVNQSWASDLAARITKTEEWKDWSNDPCTDSTVRHIGKAVIKSQRHRLLFMREASEMFAGYSELSKQTSKSITKALA